MSHLADDIAPGIDPEDPKRPWLTTRRRLGIAVGVLVVVAVGLAVLAEVVTTTRHATSSFAEVQRVVVRTDGGSVGLENASSSDVEVSRKITYVARKPSVSQKVTDDGALEVTVRCRSFNFGRCEADVALKVPASVPVEVESNGGAVGATRSQSALDIDSGSGSVELRETYGPLQVRTVGGSVTGTDLSSLEASVQSESGKIDLRFLASPRNVDTASKTGAVTVLTPKQSSPFRVDASSGTGKTTVDVRTDQSSPLTIKAHSDAGNVKVAKNG